MKNSLMKKLLCFVALALAVASGAWAQLMPQEGLDSLTATDSNGVTWYFYVAEDGGAVISSKNWACGSPTRSSATNKTYTTAELAIPDTLTYNSVAYPVTTIGYRAFYNCTAITQLTIPATVSNIERDALDGCTALAAFVLDKDNSSYHLSADSMVLISADSTMLIKIAPAATYTEYEVPSTVTTIDREAFAYCSNITQITIGSQVEYINPVTFRNCSALTKFVVDENNQCYTTLSEGQMLVDTDITTLVGLCASIETLTIPNGITEIGEGACYGFSKLTSVTIPTTVKTIGARAFRDCSVLETVTFEGANDGTATVDSIGYSVFYQCKKLNNFTLPASVEKIGEYAFGGCSSLTNFGIADDSKLSYIGSQSFYGTKITSFAVPASVTYIGTSAFYTRTTLTSLTFAEGSLLETIDAYAFQGCTKLTSIDLSDCTSLTSLGKRCFYNCTGLTSITLPAALVELGDDMFYSDTKLATIVCYAKTVPSTGNEAFYNVGSSVDGGTKVYVLPYSLADYAAADTWSTFSSDQFYPLWDLTVSSSGYAPLVLPFDATIPEGVTAYTVTAATESAQSSAYAAVSSSSLTATLTEVESDTLEAGTSVLIAAAEGTYTFFGTEGDTTSVASQDTEVDATEDLTGTYQSAGTTVSSGYVWSDDDVAFVAVTEETTVGQFEVYIAESISGIAEVALETDSMLWYYVYNSDGTSVTITSASESLESGVSNSYTRSSLEVPTTITDDNGTFTVTAIGPYAFILCTEVESITIPSTVTSLGYASFNHCEALKSIEIPASITDIDDYAFSYCYALESVTFEDGSPLTEINTACFLECTALETVEIPAKVTKIGSTAFGSSGLQTISFAGNVVEEIERCAFQKSALTEITIPASVVTIGTQAFYNCTSLASVTFEAEASLTTLGNSVWLYCSSLEEIALPASLQTMGIQTFYGCTSLESATFGEGCPIDSLGSKTFTYCEKLTEINIPEKVTKLGDYCFYQCNALESVQFAGTEVDTIGHCAFSYDYLLSDIELPTGLTELGAYAFRYCRSLESINIPAGVKAIRCSTFRQDPSNVGVLKTVEFAEGSQLEVIDTLAFYYCKNLEGMTFPATLKTIGRQAFQWAQSLTTVLFEDDSQMETFEDYAFYKCYGLQKVVIPEGVTSIGYAAFDYAYALDTLICYPEDVPSAGVDAFEDAGKNVDDGTRVFTPPYSLQAYAADATNSNGWQAFADTQYYPFAEEKVSSALVATLALPFDATIPTGVTLSTLETLTEAENDEDDDEVTGETVSTTTLGKDTPVLVSGAKAKYQYFGVEDATVDGVVSDRSAVPTKGFLTGVYAADGTTIFTTDGNYTNYVLQKQTYGTMFYKVRSAGEQVGQFRAYLQIDRSTTEAESISFVLGGTATGISAVETAGSGEAGVYYDLQGRRVLNPQKGGIYIKDGRKVIL